MYPNITFLATVMVANETYIYTNPTIVKTGTYYSINKTDKFTLADPPQRREVGVVTKRGSSIVLPINPTSVYFASDRKFTPLPPVSNSTPIFARYMGLRGETNVNPYYGVGFYANWIKTKPSQKRNHSTLYSFYYTEADLGSVPLWQICLKKCYCNWPPMCEFD